MIHFVVFTVCHKASFASVVYAAGSISVCLSVTLRYYVKTREHSVMWSSPSGSPVFLSFLMPTRMVAGRRPCPGKIWVQRGRPRENSAPVHISPHNSGTIIDSKKSSINANRKLTMGFPTSHQPRSCVTLNFLKTGFIYPNLSFFCRNFK